MKKSNPVRPSRRSGSVSLGIAAASRELKDATVQLLKVKTVGAVRYRESTDQVLSLVRLSQRLRRILWEKRSRPLPALE